jgi:hypothetical protein
MGGTLKGPTTSIRIFTPANDNNPLIIVPGTKFSELNRIDYGLVASTTKTLYIAPGVYPSLGIYVYGYPDSKAYLSGSTTIKGNLLLYGHSKNDEVSLVTNNHNLTVTGDTILGISQGAGDGKIIANGGSILVFKNLYSSNTRSKPVFGVNNGNSINFSGDLKPKQHIFNAGTSTINLVGTPGKKTYIDIDSSPFHNLFFEHVSPSGGSDDYIVMDDLTVLNDLTIQKGAVNFEQYGKNLTVGGNFTIGSGGNIYSRSNMILTFNGDTVFTALSTPLQIGKIIVEENSKFKFNEAGILSPLLIQSLIVE